MRNVRKTRKFDGRLYKLHDWYIHKPTAKIAAGTLKIQGYLTRITLRSRSKVRGGYPLSDLWYVWKRKG